MREQELTSELADKLPARLAQWAAQLAAAAVPTCPSSLDLASWGGILAALIDRESGGGIYLTPRGAAGTGDGGHGRGLGQADDNPYRGPNPDELEDPDEAAMWRREKARREKCLEFIASGRWKDARDNIRFSAEHLASYVADPACPDVDHAIAAYNAGPRAFTRGDAATTKGNYSSDVLARAGAYNLETTA